MGGERNAPAALILDQFFLEKESDVVYPYIPNAS